MATSPSSPVGKANRRRSRRQSATTEPQSRLRTIRIQRLLTQTELAKRAGMHRNSIRKLENGETHEVTAENASAIAKVLKTTIADLGLRVRPTSEARSIRIRRLSPEQRQIVDELLSLPPEDFALVRDSIERLRRKRKKKHSRGAGG